MSTPPLDPLSTILNAGLELAWAEHRREPLDEAELDALDLCDGIGEVRGIVAHEALHSRGETRQGIENQEQGVNEHVLGMPRSVASVSPCHGAVCQRFKSSLGHRREGRYHKGKHACGSGFSVLWGWAVGQFWCRRQERRTRREGRIR